MRLHIPTDSITAIKKLLNFSDIEIIDKTQTYYQDHKFKANFDAILYLDGSCHSKDKNIENAIADGIPVYGIPRIDKDKQTILLNKGNINTPKTWFANSTYDCNDIVSLLYGIPDDKLLILKYSVGARGLGQILATKREIIDIFDCDNSDLDKLFNEDVVREATQAECSEAVLQPGSPCDVIATDNIVYKTKSKPVNKQLEKLKNIKINKHEQLRRAISSGTDYIIQEYIDTRKEWRMLWFFQQQPIIVERGIDKDGWQANACNNAIGSSKTINEDLYATYGIDINLLNRFFTSLNAPFMSVDLYYDVAKEEWGIFEFQMEFGWTNTVGIDTNELHRNIVNATKMMIYPNEKLMA